MPIPMVNATRRPSRPSDTISPPSPRTSLDPPSCFACAPISTPSISLKSFPPIQQHAAAAASQPTPPSSSTSTPPSVVHHRTSTLLPRGSASIRRRISIRSSQGSHPLTAEASAGNTQQPQSEPLAPVSIATLSLDHPHSVSPSLISPQLDPAASPAPPTPSLTPSPTPSSPPPPSVYPTRRSSHRSTAATSPDIDEYDDNAAFLQHQGSVHKAAAERILKGHRKPPVPPTNPRPLLATLMVDGPEAADGAAPLVPPPSSPPPSAKDPDELALKPQGPERDQSTSANENGNGASKLEPFNVREALSKCSDPSMSWSLQFWVTIADPLTNDVFFACPASGQCSWEPPVGAFVVPRSPDGEWWELADPERGNQSYYYNTLTGVTQWDRPDGDAFVIPLGLIQRNALTTSPQRDSTESGTADSQPESQGNTTSSSGHREQLSLPVATSTASSSGPLTPIPDDAPMPAPPSDHAQDQQGTWWGRRRGRRLLSRLSKPNLKTTPERSPSLTNGTPVLHQDHSPGLYGNSNGLVASPQGSPSIDEGAFPDSVNLVLQPASPTTATYNLQNFSTDNFADRYFASRRSGVLRQRMSLEQIMEWQRAPIASPLLVLSKTSVHDAITTFKVIQHVMGDRDRHVLDARPQHIAAASVLSLRTTARPNIGSDGAEGGDEKSIILEEIRWMIQLGVGRIEMRDELYCQLMKQLTRNPDNDSTVLGFQLYCVFVSAFGPSKSFEPFVRSFLIGKLDRTDYGIGVMSKFCLTRLDTWSQKGGRGRVLSTAEIEHASDAAFYPSVYGQTLDTIMQRQEGAYPELRIPIILPFLADGILALGGTESEGIFRVPGDNDIILHLKSRIDRGQYQLSGIEDPHVVASLFKLWLRELEDPLIPTSLYETALEVSRSVDHTILFLKKLPNHNRRVLLFVISFIQLFLDPGVVAVTKMTPRNLALVLAPNILRTPDESLTAAFTNSGYECQFVLNLLLHLDPPTVDPDYVPSHGGGGMSTGHASPSSEDHSLSGSVDRTKEYEPQTPLS